MEISLEGEGIQSLYVLVELERGRVASFEVGESTKGVVTGVVRKD